MTVLLGARVAVVVAAAHVGSKVTIFLASQRPAEQGGNLMITALWKMLVAAMGAKGSKVSVFVASVILLFFVWPQDSSAGALFVYSVGHRGQRHTLWATGMAH